MSTSTKSHFKSSIFVAQLIAVMCLILSGNPTAHSKSLANRLGVGYKNQFTTTDLPSIAAQYYPNKDVGISLAMGVQSGTDDSKFGLMARVHKIIFPEENMNFYLGAGGGILSKKENRVSDSGFEFQGFLGSEFFLPGLDSLAFYFGAGFGITSLSAGVNFRTFGDSPLRAGMIFYF